MLDDMMNSAGPGMEGHRIKKALVRTFTSRRARPDMFVSLPITRAASQREGKPRVVRAQISSPMALVSTSNTNLNNAQDIVGTRPIQQRNVSETSTNSSRTSGEESNSSGDSVHSNEASLTDASSIEGSSPSTPVEPNHLSCYFKPAVDTESKTISHSRNSSTTLSIDTPKIPQRVPSHSKRAHESVHRQRSIRRMMSPQPSSREFSRSSVETTTSSQGNIEKNPFGSELSQLEEVAEEFSSTIRDAEAEADNTALNIYGLAVFSAKDYMSEIESLVHQTFIVDEDEPVSWI